MATLKTAVPKQNKDVVDHNFSVHKRETALFADASPKLGTLQQANLIFRSTQTEQRILHVSSQLRN